MADGPRVLPRASNAARDHIPRCGAGALEGVSGHLGDGGQCRSTGPFDRPTRSTCEVPKLRLPGPGGRAGVGAYHRAVAEVRECARCGTPFTPLREHARFCSPRCRMAWNREHAGVAAAPAVAIDWSVVAMTEAAERLAVARSWDVHRVAAAVGETVWWVTLVDATLVRYHPRDYESALASKAVRRRKTEGTLAGLRYVRNQLGKSVDPAEFVCPAIGDGNGGSDGGVGGWTWRPLPEPGLEGLGARSRQWELSRYHAYQGRLAERDIARTFARCAEFLAQAAGLVGRTAPPRPGTPGLRSHGPGETPASPIQADRSRSTLC